jgi:hypothetical protein
LEERAREAKSQLFILCDREQKMAAENEVLRAELIQKKKQYNESLSAMQADIIRLQEELQQVMLLWNDYQANFVRVTASKGDLYPIKKFFRFGHFD